MWLEADAGRASKYNSDHVLLPRIKVLGLSGALLEETTEWSLLEHMSHSLWGPDGAAALSY